MADVSVSGIVQGKPASLIYKAKFLSVCFCLFVCMCLMHCHISEPIWMKLFLKVAFVQGEVTVGFRTELEAA